ncbi:MAG: signal peptidase I, partial [Nanoarchaeota archaeon]|nr:signal peptidase I [Nanoarchaeota archaeon]
LILGTSFPIVAVVSNSMDHDGMGFDTWWDAKHVWYEENNITQDQFHEFDFRNGFNKGDIMVLLGVNGVDTGDVVVFWGGKKEPIIHRVVSKWDSDSSLHFQTKGDRNSRPIEAYTNSAGAIVQKGTPGAIKVLDETDISRDDLVGKAVFRIPYLGYIKIWFIDLLMFLRIV